jgi:phospholipase/carboxylesterase
LKNLQEKAEESWQFSAKTSQTGILNTGKNPKEAFLLLHGLSERGRRIYRKLYSALPEGCIVMAPNAPFPMPRVKEDKMYMGHAWYIYDGIQQKYVIDKTWAINCLKEIVKISNPNKLPLTIIGFSQGGYLGWEAGLQIPETKLMIGLGCEFRAGLFKTTPAFPLVAIHGSDDPVIRVEKAHAEVLALRDKDIHCDWHQIEGTTHEISTGVVNQVKEVLKQYGN